MPSGRAITILHLSDLQFGNNHRFAGIALTGLPNPYDTLLGRLWDDMYLSSTDGTALERPKSRRVQIITLT